MKSPDSFLFQEIQVSYKSADVPFRTMKSLSKAVIKSVLPDAKIHKVSLHEGGLFNFFPSFPLFIFPLLG
jgi:hypothetical protein